jgi:hypothetical protein
MFVLDLQAYLLLKSGQIKTKPAFSRKYALKDALGIVWRPGQTTFPFPKLPFSESHMVLNPHRANLNQWPAGCPTKG